ncbi:uncharacterized protein ACMZJ9_021153, partial [Mantella aurantiaca]
SVVSRQLRNLRSELSGSQVLRPGEAVETRVEKVLEKSLAGPAVLEISSAGLAVLEKSSAGPVVLKDSGLDLSGQEVHLESSLQGAQNDTPEIQDVGTAESKPSINSNSSADLTKPEPPAEGGADPRPGQLSAPPELLHVMPDQPNWREKTRSVVITPHRSDEM